MYVLGPKLKKSWEIISRFENKDSLRSFWIQDARIGWQAIKLSIQEGASQSQSLAENFAANWFRPPWQVILVLFMPCYLLTSSLFALTVTGDM